MTHVSSLIDHHLALVQRSADALNRAKAYEASLVAHLADLNTRIATEAAALAERDYVNYGPADVTDRNALRNEAAAVAKQHALAADALAALQAEHARHKADLGTLFGSDEEARARLKEARSARQASIEAAEKAKAILGRATAHKVAIEAKLSKARCAEQEHDRANVDRLHAALQSGDAPAGKTEPLSRTSLGIEEDARIASLTVDGLAAEHRARLAEVADALNDEDDALEGVMKAEAESVAREVLALRTRADALAGRLRTYVEHRPARRVVKPAPNQQPARPIAPGSLLMVRDPVPTALFPSRQTPIIATALQPLLLLTAPAQPPVESSGWKTWEGALLADPDAEPAFDLAPATASRAA